MARDNPFDRSKPRKSRKRDPEPEPGDENKPPAHIRIPDRSEQAADVLTLSGDVDDARVEMIRKQTQDWPPEQRAAMLASLKATEARVTVRAKYDGPASIAQACDPSFVLTPALKIIDAAIEKVLGSPRQINLLITMPPQEGKSTEAAVWTPIRALQRDANQAVVLATYAQSLAEAHSRVIRGIIGTYGTNLVDNLTRLPVEDKLGLQLARGANQISSWGVEGAAGGFVAVGIGGTLTGRKADLLIIDDPFKNMMEADSATWREKVHTWFSTVALTRLSPSASVILIQTRWHSEDLAGKILTGEKLLPKSERTWRHINVPAIAEEGITDALNRPHGTPMPSARDTPEAKRDFFATRRKVGERTWYALYQGSPRNPAGGIFQRAWFDAQRLDAPPSFPVASVVGIDPADSGDGDEAGVIGGMLMQNGHVVLTHDRSGQYTADQWARQGVLLALEIGAREVAVEAYTAAKTYTNNVKRAYAGIHKEAVDKARVGAALTPVEQRAMPDTPPFLITQWRGASKADAIARSGLISQAFETGKAHTVEFAMSVFEEQACDWQPGQHQPDRVAAGVICHDRLATLGGGGTHMVAPTNRPSPGPNNGPPAWMTRKIPG